MQYNQIVNPETGRRVNINGKIGQKVLKNYIQEMNGGTWCVRGRMGASCRKKKPRRRLRQRPGI
jgi:hypothetical protein